MGAVSFIQTKPRTNDPIIPTNGSLPRTNTFYAISLSDGSIIRVHESQLIEVDPKVFHEKATRHSDMLDYRANDSEIEELVAAVEMENPNLGVMIRGWYDDMRSYVEGGHGLPLCVCGSELQVRERNERNRLRKTLACVNATDCKFAIAADRSYYRYVFPSCGVCWIASRRVKYFDIHDEDLELDGFGSSSYRCVSCFQWIDKLSCWIKCISLLLFGRL